MKHTVYIYVIFLFIIPLIFSCSRQHNETAKRIDELLRLQHKKELDFNTYDFYAKLGIQNEDLTLNFITRLKNIFEYELTFNQIFKKNPNTLFFRYSSRSCQDCINQSLDSLKRYTEFYGLKDVVVISSFESFRQYYNAMNYGKNYFKEMTCYIPEENKVTACDSLSLPYFFTMDECKSHVTNVFFPARELPARTSSYLKNVIEKLKHKQKRH